MKVDWDAGHGPLTGPLNTAGAALAASWAGHAAHMPPAWAAVGAGTGLIGHHIAGIRHHVTRASLALRAATWIGAGAWCSWALATTPWSANSLGALGAGTAGLGMAWIGETRAGRRADQKAAEALAAERRLAANERTNKLAAEWQARFARVCHIDDVRIVAIEHWPTGSGYTLECEPPAGGTTWRQIAADSERLAADAKLPEGCGVQVGPGAHRGAFLVEVTTVNHLIEDVDYPEDYSPLSINEPVPVGVYPDGTTAELDLREATTLRVGQRGSGKTNEMNVGIAAGVRMVDNLDWVIDLNGGGLALAWLHAWQKAGRPGRPPIDWVADTPEKALLMSESAVAIAKARKTGYKHLEIEANDDKTPLSATLPGIRIRCDEIAELFSPKAQRDPLLRQVAANLVQLVEIARAAGLNGDLAGLRATQDVLSEPQLLKQSFIRIGLRVTDQAELAYLFGWEDKATPEDAPYPGSGLLKVGSAPARPFKVYRLKPAQIGDIVAACSDFQPELDDLSRQAAGDAYTDRWEGTDHLFGLAATPAPAAPAAATTSDSSGETRRSVTSDWDSPTPAPNIDTTVNDAINDTDQLLGKIHQAMDEASSQDDELNRKFLEVLGEGGALWKPPADTAPQPAPQPNDDPTPTPGIADDARWPTVFSIVAKAGPGGIGPEAIREAFTTLQPDVPPPSRAAITDWLKAEPQVYKPMRGTYAHIKHRTDTPGEQP
jgi:hypothetical protein